MNVEIWYRSECPHCDRPNWASTDESYEPVPVAILCWKCKQGFRLDGYAFDPDEDADLAFTGLRKPA